MVRLVARCWEKDGPACGFESSDPDPTANGHVSRLSNPETKRFPLFRSRARLPAQVLTFSPSLSFQAGHRRLNGLCVAAGERVLRVRRTFDLTAFDSDRSDIGSLSQSAHNRRRLAR